MVGNGDKREREKRGKLGVRKKREKRKVVSDWREGGREERLGEKKVYQKKEVDVRERESMRRRRQLEEWEGTEEVVGKKERCM